MRPRHTCLASVSKAGYVVFTRRNDPSCASHGIELLHGGVPLYPLFHIPFSTLETALASTLGPRKQGPVGRTKTLQQLKAHAPCVDHARAVPLMQKFHVEGNAKDGTSKE